MQFLSPLMICRAFLSSRLLILVRYDLIISYVKNKLSINPPTYTQSYTPTVVQRGGGGLLKSLPWVFAVLKYLENILLLINTLSRVL